MTKTILQGSRGVREWTTLKRVDKPGLHRDTNGGRRQEEVETAGFKVIGGAPTTLRVTGLMMMINAFLTYYVIIHTQITLRTLHTSLTLQRIAYILRNSGAKQNIISMHNREEGCAKFIIRTRDH